MKIAILLGLVSAIVAAPAKLPTRDNPFGVGTYIVPADEGVAPEKRALPLRAATKVRRENPFGVGIYNVPADEGVSPEKRGDKEARFTTNYVVPADEGEAAK